jgi:hypothetical protein
MHLPRGARKEVVLIDVMNDYGCVLDRYTELSDR